MDLCGHGLIVMNRGDAGQPEGARSRLTPAQRRQVELQIALHREHREKYVLDPVQLSDGAELRDLLMHPGVLQPMSSRRLAAYLHRTRGDLRGKAVIDMGSGSGIQGITAALYGAERVILSDVTTEAYENTCENVERFGVADRCDVRRGDLFETLPERADIVVFAQPYFLGVPDPADPFTYGMLDEGELIHRFLDEARAHVSGQILMCHLDLAGEESDPAVQGPKHGYRVAEVCVEIISSGVQRGRFCVCTLEIE